MFDDYLNESDNDDIKKDYFNFPIVLLEGFLIDYMECLNNIFDYSIYGYLNKAYESDFNKIKEAESFFGVNIGNKKRSFENGKTLFESIPEKLPFTGIRKSIWFDYYKNQKTEFQKVCLLAFLAIKSIVGKKLYCKTNYSLMFSRMSGISHTIKNKSELPPELIDYFIKRRQSDKIIANLKSDWKLKHYGYHTKGFYVSFKKDDKIDLEGLIKIVEKNRKSRKEKEMKDLEKSLRLKVLKELNIK